MTQGNLKTIMSVLLVATGVFHLIVASIGAPPQLQAPLGVFGVAYLALGIWTRSGGRTAVLVSLLVTLLGLVLGGRAYLTDGGPVALPIMFLIDVAIIGAAGMWLTKDKPAKKI